MSDINDDKKFWKNVKPIFGNKNKGNKTIALEEGNEVILRRIKPQETKMVDILLL